MIALFWQCYFWHLGCTMSIPFPVFTEGGVLGMTLLLDRWFHISPSVSGFVMNLACYAMGWKLLGGSSSPTPFFPAPASPCLTGSVSSFRPVAAACRYAACRIPARRNLRRRRCRLCVRIGGAPGGDDALAMSLSHVTHIKIQWIYLLSDFAVLVLSLSYIPFKPPWHTPSSRFFCPDRSSGLCRPREHIQWKIWNLIVFIQFSRFQTCPPVNSNELLYF